MQYLLLIFLSILTCGSLQAQNDLDIYFTVQIAAAKNPIPKTNKVFGDMPNLNEMKFPDGYYRYFSGNFMAPHFAEDYLKKVKAMGYEDAYIVAIKNQDQRISEEEAIELIYGE